MIALLKHLINYKLLEEELRSRGKPYFLVLVFCHVLKISADCFSCDLVEEEEEKDPAGGEEGKGEREAG